jgi:hypothetical protein
MLVTQLYVCIILTCYLTDFSGLDTCVCWFTCEKTSLVVFLSLSLFSKIFFLWLFTVSFSFDQWNCYCGFSNTLFYPLSFWDKNGEYFFDLDRDCIFNPVKWFLSQNGQMGSLLVCDWLHFFWTRSFLCNVAYLINDIVIFRVYTSFICFKKTLCRI